MPVLKLFWRGFVAGSSAFGIAVAWLGAASPSLILLLWGGGVAIVLTKDAVARRAKRRAHEPAAGRARAEAHVAQMRMEVLS